jgi:hypothetical protein
MQTDRPFVELDPKATARLLCCRDNLGRYERAQRVGVAHLPGATAPAGVHDELD